MTGRNFTRGFKLQVVQELLSGRPVVEVCREHSLYASLVCTWRRNYQKNPELAFNGRGVPSTEETKNAELERKIGQLYLENDFLKRVNSALQQKLAEAKKKERGEKNAIQPNQN